MRELKNEMSEVRKAFENTTVFGDSRWQTWQKAWLTALSTRGTKTIADLKILCVEAYEVVGTLAVDAGKFGEPHIMKALDNLSHQSRVHADVLPLDAAAPQTGGRSKDPSALHIAEEVSAPMSAPLSTQTHTPENEKNAARLNWLEQFHPLPNGPSNAFGEVGLKLISRTNDGWKLAAVLGGTEYQTLHQAIDAAMSEYQWTRR